MQNLHTWLGIARRTAIQAIGTVVAVFASGRAASAADISYSGLYCYKVDTPDYLSQQHKNTWLPSLGGDCSLSGHVGGKLQACINNNGWVPMSDSACVEKLQKVGLCEHTDCAVGDDGRPMSDNCKIMNTYGIGGEPGIPGKQLTCADVDAGAAESCDLKYDSSSGRIYPLKQSASCGDKQFLFTVEKASDYDVDTPEYAWAKCDFASGADGVVCFMYRSGDTMECDTPSSYSEIIRKGSGLSVVCPDVCTQAFQDHFNDYIQNPLSGACLANTNGVVTVRGSAKDIALIYEFCYDPTAASPYIGDWSVGCMFEGCQYNSGWFLNISNPGFYDFTDWSKVGLGSGVCAPCASGVVVSGMENMSPQWDSGAVKYTALPPSQWGSGVSGSASCRATIPTTSYSGKTSSGAFVLELQDSGVCEYNSPI